MFFLKITLLKIASIVLIIYVIYLVINYIIKQDRSLDNWGGVAAISLFFFGLVGLAIDWLFLRFISNYWIVMGIEAGILGIIFFLDFYNRQEKTIIIPDNFQGYITIIYNVKGEKPLYKYPITLSYEIEIPDNGIKFTSTTHKRDRFKVEFRTRSGTLLDHSSNPDTLHPHPYENGVYKCGESSWYFKTWLIHNKSGWNKSVDIDTVTPKLLEEFCRRKTEK